MKRIIAGAVLLTAVVVGIGLRFKPAATRPVMRATPSFSVLPASQSARRQQSSPPGSQPANILILPEASPDFIGYWGGFVHSRVHSIIPGYLTGTSPARVSVMFGQAGNTIFMGSELYGSRRQRIIGRPRAQVINPAQAVITYASEDRQLYYRCKDSFRLTRTGRIQYRGTIDVYQRSTRTLVGIVSQRASLVRLLSASRRREFARPSASEIPRGAVAASSNFAPATATGRTTLELPKRDSAISHRGG